MTRPRNGDRLRLGDGSQPKLGMKVIRLSEPRHVGSLVRINKSAWATVVWSTSNWVSNDIRVTELGKPLEEAT
jgi:hypothetical protein